MAYGVDGALVIKCFDIPYYPIATNKDHGKELIYAEVNGKKALFFAGRIHIYEGYRSFYHSWVGYLSAFLGC